MKSVALSESGAHESSGVDNEDFILVQQPATTGSESAPWALSFDNDDGVDDDDDASYDRCEDAYSIYSAPQSLAIDSNALESFQPDFFSSSPREQSLPPFYPSFGEDGEILLRGISAIALEATDQSDDGGRHGRTSAAAAVEPHPFEASVESSVSGPSDEEVGRSIVGARAAASSSSESSFPDAAEHQPPRVANPAPPLCGSDRLVIDDDDEDPSSSGTDDRTGVGSGGEGTASSTKSSRLCNKKRRKQLKLARKAAAAAAAAAALTHLGGMVATRTSNSGSNNNNNTPKLKRHATASNASKNRKQVANIAVACATESLARYREECVQQQQHQPSQK